MVSTIIVHVIGIAALSAILVAVIIHTSMITNTMIHDNIKRVLEETANILVLQINYALNAGINLTINLEYPILAGKDAPYNIYIGTGSKIKSIYPWTDIPNDSNIYVFLIEPKSRVYIYKYVASPNYNGYTIILSNDPLLFASTYAVKLRKVTIGNIIELSIIRGEVVYH